MKLICLVVVLLFPVCQDYYIGFDKDEIAAECELGNLFKDGSTDKEITDQLGTIVSKAKFIQGKGYLLDLIIVCELTNKGKVPRLGISIITLRDKRKSVLNRAELELELKREVEKMKSKIAPLAKLI